MESSCTQCIKGSIHAGEPQGKQETIHGLNTYVIGNRTNPRAIIVMYSDVFGLNLPNNLLIADAYAKSGEYLVYLPDFFEGDPIKIDLADILIPVDEKKQSRLSKYTGLLANIPGFLMWRRRHSVEHTDKICMEFLERLRRATPKSQKIGIVGFCWGGKYALRAGREQNSIEMDEIKVPLVDAVAVLHPSNLALPEDVEKIIVPASYGWGEADSSVKIELKDEIAALHEQEIKDGKTEKEMEHKVYKPGRHGFGVRGNPDDPTERAILENTEKQVLDWFGRWL